MSFLVSFLRSVRFMLKAFRRGDQHTAGRLSVTVFGKSGGGAESQNMLQGLFVDLGECCVILGSNLNPGDQWKEEWMKMFPRSHLHKLQWQVFTSLSAK